MECSSQIEGGTLVGSTLSIPNATSAKFSVDVDNYVTLNESGSISVDDGVVIIWHLVSSFCRQGDSTTLSHF